MENNLLSLIGIEPTANEADQPQTVGSADAMHRLIAMCRADGDSPSEIAYKLDMDESVVGLLLEREDVIDLTLRMQTALNMPLEQRLESAASIAFEKQYALLHSDDEKTRMAVSQQILDRHMGKAAQKIESITKNFNMNADVSIIDKDIEQAEKRLNAMESERLKLLGNDITL